MLHGRMQRSEAHSKYKDTHDVQQSGGVRRNVEDGQSRLKAKAWYLFICSEVLQGYIRSRAERRPYTIPNLHTLTVCSEF